ncbi:MAG: hypothetical protein ACE5HE_00725 [Phycisphaerae bacterium]
MNAVETAAPNRANQRRRRSHIINPIFQWKYALLMSGSVFFVSTFISVVLFGVLNEQARARIVNPQANSVWEGTAVMILAAVIFAALTAGAVGFWSMYLTHRIAGPLYVLENYLREMIAGRLPRVRELRKKDEFKELHRMLRKTVEVIRARERTNLNTLTDALNIAKSSAHNDSQSAKRALDEITSRIEALRAQAAGLLGEDHEDVGAPQPSGGPGAAPRSKEPCAPLSV